MGWLDLDCPSSLFPTVGASSSICCAPPPRRIFFRLTSHFLPSVQMSTCACRRRSCQRSMALARTRAVEFRIFRTGIFHSTNKSCQASDNASLNIPMPMPMHNASFEPLRLLVVHQPECVVPGTSRPPILLAAAVVVIATVATNNQKTRIDSELN